MRNHADPIWRFVLTCLFVCATTCHCVNATLTQRDVVVNLTADVYQRTNLIISQDWQYVVPQGNETIIGVLWRQLPLWGVDELIKHDTLALYIRQSLQLYFYNVCNIDMLKRMSNTYMQRWDFKVRGNVCGLIEHSYGFSLIQFSLHIAAWWRRMASEIFVNLISGKDTEAILTSVKWTHRNTMQNSTIIFFMQKELSKYNLLNVG